MDTASNRAAPPPVRLARWLLWIAGMWCGLLTIALVAAEANTTDLPTRVMLGMILSLIVLWILGAGLLSLAARRPLRAWAERHPHGWQLRFILLATTLALVEEAVTVIMTNLGPGWGATFVQAHITASANYFDVVLLHSVIVFVPMFIAWAWLLSHYAFAPAAVLLLFGVTGFLAEAGSFGANPITLGLWIFVYGLMVYLPANLAPATRTARSPHLGVIVLAILLPIVAAIPIALIVQAIHTVYFSTLP